MEDGCHLWYSYLHLIQKSANCREIYHTWMVWVYAGVDLAHVEYKFIFHNFMYLQPIFQLPCSSHTFEMNFQESDRRVEGLQFWSILNLQSCSNLSNRFFQYNPSPRGASSNSWLQSWIVGWWCLSTFSLMGWTSMDIVPTNNPVGLSSCRRRHDSKPANGFGWNFARLTFWGTAKHPYKFP